MGRHDQFGCPVIAQYSERFHVPFKRGLERLRLLPFWMQWGHGLQAIERESQLGIDRMFHPQGPVIVEHRDAFGGRHEIWPALQRNAGNEVSDRPFAWAVVPRGKEVGLRLRLLQDGKRRSKQD